MILNVLFFYLSMKKKGGDGRGKLNKLACFIFPQRAKSNLNDMVMGILKIH